MLQNSSRGSDALGYCSDYSPSITRMLAEGSGGYSEGLYMAAGMMMVGIVLMMRRYWRLSFNFFLLNILNYCLSIYQLPDSFP